MEAMPSRPITDIDEVPREHHICPWWVGYLITNPLRKLVENPKTILSPLTEPAMMAVDIGCGMGFFSLPMARMVGDGGRVICVDVQEKMLAGVRRRARRERLDHIIETRLATQEDLGLDDLQGEVDLVLAVHVLHETAYPRRFLFRCLEALRPGARMLVIEPKGHVSEDEFEATTRLALEIGFSELGCDDFARSRTLLLSKSTP